MNLNEMNYDELSEHITEAMKELRRRAYGMGYEQGKFDQRMETAFDDVKRVVNEETPQEKRDRIIERAKVDIKELRDEGNSMFGQVYMVNGRLCNVEFIVNKKKRTVVALLRGIDTGIIRAKGIAKCAPGDCFNVWIGKAIALRRALGLEIPSEYLNAPQPTEVRVGDIVYDEHYKMKGKVYAINPLRRTYNHDRTYFGKEKGWLTYIDPQEYERRIKQSEAKIIDDSRVREADEVVE